MEFLRLPSLIPMTVTMRRQHTFDDVKLHDKRNLAYVIKVTNQLALSYSKGRLSQGASFNHISPLKAEGVFLAEY